MQGFELNRVYAYSLPFKTPLRVGDKILDRREGFIIHVTRGDGTAGYGEVAPLPGYSRETLVQAKEQLFGLAGLTPNDLYSSVAFGLETALNKSFWESGTLFSKRVLAAGGIEVNALLHPDRGRIEDQVRELIEGGFTTIKIKVGRGSVTEDIEVVNRAVEGLAGGARLRLDANRLWGVDEAVAFGRGVDGSVIEYIEEPFEDISSIPKFYAETGIPVALDESLPSLMPVPAVLVEGLRALALKPSMLGGIGKTLSWIQFAKRCGLKPVISSCFEAGPGFAALLGLAASIDFDDSASGLDTLKYLAEDLFVRPIEITKGKIGIEYLRRFRENSPEELYDFEKLTLLTGAEG
jgi:O-succinylbenzoate synthase